MESTAFAVTADAAPNSLTTTTSSLSSSPPATQVSQYTTALDTDAIDALFSQLERVAEQIEDRLRSVRSELTDAIADGIDFVLQHDWRDLTPELLRDRLESFWR